jgi:hypothetical protein
MGEGSTRHLLENRKSYVRSKSCGAYRGAVENCCVGYRTTARHGSDTKSQAPRNLLEHFHIDRLTK